LGTPRRRGPDIKYRFVSISIADAADAEDGERATKATTKTFTGQRYDSDLMILQDFARRGVVYQVSFDWLEPTGWSFARSDKLDILKKNEIKTPEIIRRASNYVHHARLRRALLFKALAVAVSVAALVLGIGVAWVRRVFATHHTLFWLVDSF
jgi:hypothetical protein